MGKKKSRRGFAAMDPEKRRAIASKGGKAVHAKGAARTLTHDEAVVAGRKGARATHAKGLAHKFTDEEARRGRKKGGRARWQDRPGRHQAMPAPKPGHRRGETRGRPADEARRAEADRRRASHLPH